MIIATLESKPVLGQREGNAPEGGIFSLPVHLEEEEWQTFPTPRDAVMKTVAIYLASAVKDTGLPTNMWLCHFAPAVIGQLSLPETIDFDMMADFFKGV